MKKQIIIGIILGLLSGSAFAADVASSNINASLAVPVVTGMSINGSGAIAAHELTVNNNAIDAVNNKEINSIEVDYNKSGGFKIHLATTNDFKYKDGDKTPVAYKLSCDVQGGLSGAAPTNVYTTPIAFNTAGTCVTTTTFDEAAADLMVGLRVDIESNELSKAINGGNYTDTITVTLQDQI